MSPSELATINAGLGRVFARFRSDLNMNQTDFGRLFGYGQQTVSEIEGGKRELKAAEVILICRELANHLPGWDEVAIGRQFSIEERTLRLIATDGKFSSDHLLQRDSRSYIHYPEQEWADLEEAA